jgi:hypothetical protein
MISVFGFQVSPRLMSSLRVGMPVAGCQVGVARISGQMASPVTGKQPRNNTRSKQNSAADLASVLPDELVHAQKFTAGILQYDHNGADGGRRPSRGETERLGLLAPVAEEALGAGGVTNRSACRGPAFPVQ